MSEENTIEKADSTRLVKEGESGVVADSGGATVSGGWGGVTDPGYPGVGPFAATDAGIGLAPFAEGSTSGPNAVNPTGNLGGQLNPEQANRFIDYVWDATVLAKDGRRVNMRANTMEIDKVNVGERVIRGAKQALAIYENAAAKFTKIELVTTKIRLDWEVSTEALEDNIEGAALEDHLVRLMTNAFGNDLEDLAINGDRNIQVGDPLGNGGVATDNDVAFLSILDGFCTQTVNGARNSANLDDQAAHFVEGPVADENGVLVWSPEILQNIINALPRKYRAVRSGLKFYASTDTFNNIVQSNGTGPFGTYDQNIWTYDYRNTYLDGNDQTIGPARQTRVLGIPVLEVPYFPDNHVELTFPANRVWGFQRNITVNREYQPKKDTIEYTVFVRFGIAWEELDAVAYASAGDDSSDGSFDGIYYPQIPEPYWDCDTAERIAGAAVCDDASGDDASDDDVLLP